MDRAERQKLILLVLLIGMFAYFGYNGIGAFKGVKGLQESAAKLKKERDDLALQVRNAQGMLQNLDRIKKERQALEVQLQELSRRLPSERESAEVLRNVETLARKAGLAVGQVKRKAPRSQELYVEIPVEVGMTGGYQQLRRFSDELSQLPRLATLNELAIKTFSPARQTPGTAAAQSTDTVNVNMVTVVYQAPPRPEPAAAPAAPAPQR
jgi:type IV pilus assembly protein PilO